MYLWYLQFRGIPKFMVSSRAPDPFDFRHFILLKDAFLFLLFYSMNNESVCNRVCKYFDQTHIIQQLLNCFLECKFALVIACP